MQCWIDLCQEGMSKMAVFWGIITIGLVSVVAYFVIKKAVKDALREYHNESNQ